jgi:integrase
MARATGIVERHGRACASRNGAACNCKPSFEAWAYVAREGRKVRKTFPTFSAAKAWRTDATAAAQRGKLRTPSRLTVREAAEALIAGMADGTVRNRSGDAFKPSVVRGYESALRLYVLDDLGAARLSEVRRHDVQDLADRLLAECRDPSTIHNALMPLRVIYRRALARDEVAVNPTTGVELPAVRRRRERTATLDEMEALLAALSESDRPLWATAFYAGLRLGELRALRWKDVDLASELPLIRVERSWDPRAGLVAPKSAAGVRSVPVVAPLRTLLREHRLRSGSREGFVLGRLPELPFARETVVPRARRAWTQAGLEPIGLHEARHSFVSLWHDAGVSIDRIGDYAGHSGSGITQRYRHLRDGRLADDVKLVEAHLIAEAGKPKAERRARG